MNRKTKNSKLTVVGTWAMVEAWDIGDDPKQPKKKTYPWGNPPSGYWVFDTSGHFSLMISKDPPLAIPAGPFPVTGAENQPGWLSPAAPWKVPYELMIETFSATEPYAYFGTYTVQLDSKNPKRGGTLNLKVFADVMRSYTGTVQKRQFVFDGSNYINVGVPGQYLRRLKRLT